MNGLPFFFKLTSPKGEPVLVNVAAIETIRPFVPFPADGMPEAQSVISYAGGGRSHVREGLAEIEARFRAVSMNRT